MGKINVKEIKFDEKKFKELVLYVADKCSDDPDYGALKLNKIFFYADFIAYGQSGKPITGSPYFRLPKGPAPRCMMPIREAMESDGDIAIHKKVRFGHPQHRVVPLREADLTEFTAQEIAIVDEVIEGACGASGTDLALMSHHETGVKLANLKEDIPYETVFICDEPLNESEIQRGLQLARQYEWAI
ncbi:MAG: Panacea domain-containing protein [Chloroflexi bacterium]|nr:Panacea domain-containing protein [Chloroflexota bacterium]